MCGRAATDRDVEVDRIRVTGPAPVSEAEPAG